MKTLNGDKVTPKTLNNKLMTTPSTIYASKVLGKDLEIDNSFLLMNNSSLSGTISEMWSQQHPLINTWLILSSVSICFLSGLLFIIH